MGGRGREGGAAGGDIEKVNDGIARMMDARLDGGGECLVKLHCGERGVQ